MKSFYSSSLFLILIILKVHVLRPSPSGVLLGGHFKRWDLRDVCRSPRGVAPGIGLWYPPNLLHFPAEVNSFGPLLLLPWCAAWPTGAGSTHHRERPPNREPWWPILSVNWLSQVYIVLTEHPFHYPWEISSCTHYMVSPTSVSVPWKPLNIIHLYSSVVLRIFK